jgi:hypothetical protein
MNANEVEIAALAKRTQPFTRPRFVWRVYGLTKLFTVFRWRPIKIKLIDIDNHLAPF